MASKKLRKYLAYYQKTLREEPDNIEARLRLAALFRDMGRDGHAVEEYVTASKLLAREGLPLEAIAACKAVLELEPRHTETQMFLARLFARVPDVAGAAARIARPVEPSEAGPVSTPVSKPAEEATSEAPEPITLSQPKDSAGGANEEETAVGPSPEDETTVSSSGLIQPFDEGSEQEDDEVSEVGEDDEPTAVARSSDLPDLDDMRVREEREETLNLGTVSRREPTASDEEVRSTVEMDASDRDSVLRAMASISSEPDEDLRVTVDVEDDDIVEEQSVDTGQANDAGDPRDRLDTPRLGHRAQQNTGRPKAATHRGMASAPKESTDPEDDADGQRWEETFEVGVFDMESLRLDREASGEWDNLSFLDELDEPDTAEIASALEAPPGRVPEMSVSRADLPEIPLFSQLEPGVFVQLLRVMDYVEVDEGTAIVEPGRFGRSLFVIVRGTAVVERTLEDDSVVELARLREGEFFGEFALLTGESQMATVSADTDMALLEVSEDVIDRIAREHPEIWDVLWDFYHARMLNNLLASSRIFRGLSKEQREQLADQFALQEVPAGELLLGEGERDFDLYLICNGVVCVERGDRAGPDREIDTLRAGEFVGLISSTDRKPVVANLRAERDTTLLVLEGEKFRRLLDQNQAVAQQVRQVVRERKAIAGKYTSGVTSYAELGVAARSTESSD
jgi:CRP-like cAMP-binding protein